MGCCRAALHWNQQSTGMERVHSKTSVAGRSRVMTCRRQQPDLYRLGLLQDLWRAGAARYPSQHLLRSGQGWAALRAHSYRRRGLPTGILSPCGAGKSGCPRPGAARGPGPAPLRVPEPLPPAFRRFPVTAPLLPDPGAGPRRSQWQLALLSPRAHLRHLGPISSPVCVELQRFYPMARRSA